jgi:hypothetical protein
MSGIKTVERATGITANINEKRIGSIGMPLLKMGGLSERGKRPSTIAKRNGRRRLRLDKGKTVVLCQGSWRNCQGI